MKNSAIQIDFARQLLNNCLTFLKQETPSQLSQETRENLSRLCKMTEDVIEKMKTPTLRLAFVGATSSGKSTLVNALLGHAVVPMEAGEMSAGVVQITNEDRDNVHLDIQGPDDPSDKSLWSEFHGDLSDEEAFDLLKDTMLKYHNHRKGNRQTYCGAPNVKARSSMMLAHEKSPLQLPENVNLEIIDLPGIKEMNDVANLKVNQELLHQAVLVITLNYEDTSESRLETLLEEVKKVIEAFKSTNTIFFVLNKIDSRQKNDIPIPEKVEYLKKKIAPIIGVKPTEVTISPIKAMQLFLYQIAYGSSENTMTDSQIKYLAHAFSQYWLFEEQEKNDDEDLIPKYCKSSKRTLNKIAYFDKKVEGGLDEDGTRLSEREIERAKEKISENIEVFREDYLADFLENGARELILTNALKQSGGKRFLDDLSKRIEEHLPQLVIQPLIHSWLIQVEELKDSIKGEKSAILESTGKSFREFIQKLDSTQKKLQESLDSFQKQIEDGFDSYIKVISQGKRTETDKARKDLEKNEFLAPFMDVEGILEGIKKEATYKILERIILPFLENETYSLGTLLNDLRGAGCGTNISNRTAKDLKKIKEYYVHYPDGHLVERDLSLEPLVQDYQESFVNANCSVIELLGSFFQRSLQTKVEQFEKKMDNVVEIIRKKLFKIIIHECNISEEIANGLVPSTEYIRYVTNKSFDTELLRIPSTPEVSKKIEIIESYQDRTWVEYLTWLITRTPKQRKVKMELPFLELSMPEMLNLVVSWDECIEPATIIMCRIISEWFRTNAGLVRNKLNDRFPTIIRRYKDLSENMANTEQAKKDKIFGEWNQYGDSTTQNLEIPVTQMQTLIEKGIIEEN